MDNVVHFEIPADNLKRAETFYHTVFDWSMQSIPMPRGAYTIVRTVETDQNNMPVHVGAINGGMFEREGQEISPVIVMNVASIDETIKKVEASGGSLVMPKQQVMEMGLYARVKDTEGNVIGIWEDLKKKV